MPTKTNIVVSEERLVGAGSALLLAAAFDEAGSVLAHFFLGPDNTSFWVSIGFGSLFLVAAILVYAFRGRYAPLGALVSAIKVVFGLYFMQTNYPAGVLLAFVPSTLLMVANTGLLLVLWNRDRGMGVPCGEAGQRE